MKYLWRWLHEPGKWVQPWNLIITRWENIRKYLSVCTFVGKCIKGGPKWALFHFELQYSGNHYFMSNRFRITNLQITLENFCRQTSYLQKKYAASAIRPRKNDIHWRGKSMKQKLLELVQVTVPNFDEIWKNEAVMAQKTVKNLDFDKNYK